VTTIADFATSHPEFKVLRPPGAQDQARIRFNHAVHLRHEYDDAGKLVKGVLNERGELEDLAKDCSTCHEPDAERRFMRPINYENHCARCHPLLFDHGSGPGNVVPHERPEIVLGFLTRHATSAVLGGASEPAAGGGDNLRQLPGVPYRPALSADQADERDRLVREAAVVALDHTHTLFGAEAKGGCRFCHDIDVSAPATGETAQSLVAWQVVPPQIPDRWLAHAEFTHDAHRLLNCRECHANADTSELTSDILVPGIDLCRRCHSDLAEAVGTGLEKAASRCVDCHSYHDRAAESLSGGLTTSLTPRADGEQE
jgi:hypothetical protein